MLSELARISLLFHYAHFAGGNADAGAAAFKHKGAIGVDIDSFPFKLL